jgi:LacI family transcriptional regulator
VVTIRDVASAAGVSIATVSRVFNDSSRVSPAAARRVRSAASRLDYWPNVAARSLTTSRSHAIGVLLPDLFGEFFSEVIRGIDQAARSHKHTILISSSHADAQELLTAARSMRGRIDGLIAMAPDKASAAAMHSIARGFPVVLLDPRARISGCCTVSVANQGGAAAMVEHLVRLGHRDVAIVKGPVGNVDAEDRLRGWRQALRAAGLEVRAGWQIEGDFSEAAGYRAAKALLALRPRPSAVFAANDYMALGLLSALRDAGIDVPREMAVTGFDDIAIAQYLSPPLTTVRVDAYELGARAVQLWMQAAAGNGAAPRHEVLPARLVVRHSCGATRAHAADTRAGRGRRARIPAIAEAGAAGNEFPDAFPSRSRIRNQIALRRGGPKP